MKLVILIGNTSVGKMTVGQELMKITDLRLFHNHMAIEPVIEVFGQFIPDTIARLRDVIFEDFAKSDSYGMIFTFMWAFDQKSDWDYITHVCDIFRACNAEIYYIELIASQGKRLERNSTENRLRHKASKRDLKDSTARLLNDDRAHRCVSHEGEITFDNYLRIDNTDLSAEIVARQIKEKFNL